MSTIENANGKALSINSEGSAFVLSHNRGDNLQEILRGWSFAVVVPTVTPTGAGDYFLMIQNDSTDPLVIDSIEFSDAGGADAFYIEVGAAYTVGGTHATTFSAQNQLVGSTNVYSSKATIECGVDITGITASDNEVFRAVTATTQTHYDLSYRPIVLGQGQQASFASVTGTAALTSMVVRYHHVMTPAVNY